MCTVGVFFFNFILDTSLSASSLRNNESHVFMHLSCTFYALPVLLPLLPPLSVLPDYSKISTYMHIFPLSSSNSHSNCESTVGLIFILY